MERSVRDQRIIWAIGTIALGILSAALWDALKPVVGWIGMGLLEVVTLGMSSLQDGIYADIAQGRQQRAALGTFGGFIGAGIGLLTIAILRRSGRNGTNTDDTSAWLA